MTPFFLSLNGGIVQLMKFDEFREGLENQPFEHVKELAVELVQKTIDKQNKNGNKGLVGGVPDCDCL